MGKVTTLNFFAALPGRAATDDRLTALHFRVLMVIAGYDRMGRNGQCCWAGRKKLASHAGCHPNSLSAAISELVGMGYLTEERHESDGRKKGFRVVYDAEKDARGIGIERQENRSSPDYLSRKRRSAGVHSRKGDRSATDYPSVEDRSPDDPLSDQLPEEKHKKIQYLIDGAHKPNILRRNVRYKSEDCKVPYGARTHETIVQALKPYNGWGILLSLPQATREYLEQRCTDGLTARGRPAESKTGGGEGGMMAYEFGRHNRREDGSDEVIPCRRKHSREKSGSSGKGEAGGFPVYVTTCDD